MPRKPFRFNAALEAQRQTQLDTAGMDRFAPSGRSLSFTPVMRGSGSDPTLAVNSYMRYVRQNNVVTAWFAFIFATVGSGNYSFDLPVPAVVRFTASPTGRWNGNPGAGTNEWEGRIRTAGAFGVFYYLPTQGSASVLVSATAPAVWAATNSIHGELCYEAADGYT